MSLSEERWSKLVDSAIGLIKTSGVLDDASEEQSMAEVVDTTCESLERLLIDTQLAGSNRLASMMPEFRSRVRARLAGAE